MNPVEPSRRGGLRSVLAGVLDAWLSRQGAMLSIKDAVTGRYEHVNDAMARFLGRAGAQVLGHTDAELVDPALATGVARGRADGAGPTAAPEQRTPLRMGGRAARLRRAALAVTGAQGRRWLCSVWTDQGAAAQKDSQLRAALEQLEQQQRANEKLRLELADQGLRDSATGLYTRPHFEDQLRREVDLSTREHREFALVLIEIDPFTGRVPRTGCRCRRRASSRPWAGCCAATPGPWTRPAGCDERLFGVLLSGVGLATAHSRMEGLRRQCATQIVVLDGQELGFSVSMGVASFPHTAASQQELLSACEGALAEARRRGGNHLTLASIRFEAG